MPKAVLRDWLEPTQIEWEHEGQAWQIQLLWADIDGFAECAGITVEAAEPGTVLRASTLRALPIGQLVRTARRRRFRDVGGEVVEALRSTEAEADLPAGFAAEASAWVGPSGRRRPYLGDEHYVEVARIYSNALARGTAPRKAVAEAMHTSEPSASRWISAARHRGLLPATVPGRAKALSPVPSSEEKK